MTHEPLSLPQALRISEEALERSYAHHKGNPARWPYQAQICWRAAQRIRQYRAEITTRPGRAIDDAALVQSNFAMVGQPAPEL